MIMGIAIIAFGCFIIVNGWLKKPVKKKPLIKCKVDWILN